MAEEGGVGFGYCAVFVVPLHFAGVMMVVGWLIHGVGR